LRFKKYSSKFKNYFFIYFKLIFFEIFVLFLCDDIKNKISKLGLAPHPDPGRLGVASQPNPKRMDLTLQPNPR